MNREVRRCHLNIVSLIFRKRSFVIGSSLLTGGSEALQRGSETCGSVAGRRVSEGASTVALGGFMRITILYEGLF